MYRVIYYKNGKCLSEDNFASYEDAKNWIKSKNYNDYYHISRLIC